MQMSDETHLERARRETAFAGPHPLFAVTELGDDVVQFFECDESPAVSQFVLIDRFGQFDHFRPERLAGINELPALAPVFSRTAGLSAIDKGGNFRCIRGQNDVLHFGTPRRWPRTQL